MPFKKGDAKPATSGRRKRSESQLQLEYWPVSRLAPYARNPRKNDKAVDRMRASIKEFGFSVPVVLCDNWTDAQVKAFRLLANRSVNWADWDMEALALEFGELKALEFDLSLTGFDSREIDQLTLTPNSAEDDIPPVPEVPVTQPGDLWLMGGHRLLCGDCTKAEDVARLMQGKRAGLISTDAPYGINYDSAQLHEHGVSFAKI